MKTLAVLLIASQALACAPGCLPYEGVCACSQPAEKVEQTYKPSDEKPPRDKMPSYQREGIKAEMPSSLASEDAKLDEDKAKAEIQGKKAAGIK